MAEQYKFANALMDGSAEKKVLASAAALKLEATFISIMDDSQLGILAKRKKLQGAVDLMSKYSTSFERDVRLEMCKKVVQEGMQKLVSGHN